MSLSGSILGMAVVVAVVGDREENVFGKSLIQPSSHLPGIPLKIAGFLFFRTGFFPHFWILGFFLDSLILRSELSVELVLGRRRRGRSRGV